MKFCTYSCWRLRRINENAICLSFVTLSEKFKKLFSFLSSSDLTKGEMAKESAAEPKVKAAGIVKKDESRNGLAYFISYFLFTVVIVAYSGFLYDTEGFRSHAKTFVVLQPFEVLFDTVEKYSPFHQVSVH